MYTASCRVFKLFGFGTSVTWSVLGPAQLRKVNAVFNSKIIYFFGFCSKIGN